MVDVIRTAAQVAGDEEIGDRVRAAEDTCKRFAKGLSITDGGTLVALVGRPVVSKLDSWLCASGNANREARPNVASLIAETPSTKWPDPPDADAFHGLAGDIVRTFEPNTESDPTAILVQFLVAFGNIGDCSPYYRVEGDAHHTNLFAVLVGATSKARKGTSWGQVRRLMLAAAGTDVVDQLWYSGSIKSGLSSGEGLIFAVRDASGDDAGSSDRRLLVVAARKPARPLVAMGRDGNVLSELLRQCWDTGDLRIMTKNSPASATGAHISLLGHVTTDDLRRHLSTTEQANGFANRILWVCVRRSKTLPDGGSLSDEAIAPLASRLKSAIKFASTVREMRRDDGARELWRDVYPELSEGRPGLLGAVISRGEAQVLRLSMLYALLDSSDVIRAEHLRAALAVWDYAEASARHIFGDSIGNPIADTILSSLRSRSAAGMTRTDIRDTLGRHAREAQISIALASLQELGLARHTREETGGRPIERWFAG